MIGGSPCFPRIGNQAIQTLRKPLGLSATNQSATNQLPPGGSEHYR